MDSGADVIVLDQDEAELEELKLSNPKIQTVVANLQKWEESRKVLESLEHVHHLVNNAGIARPAETLMDIKSESIDE